MRDSSRAARCFGGSAATAASSARASSRPAAPCSGSMAARIGQRRALAGAPASPLALPEVDPQLALGPPELVQAEVGRDREDPGRKPALGPIASAEAEHLDEDVLGDLLGTRLAADQAADVLQDARREALEQLLERLLVPLLHREHEADVGVGRRGDVRPLGPRRRRMARRRDARHRRAAILGQAGESGIGSRRSPARATRDAPEVATLVWHSAEAANA